MSKDADFQPRIIVAEAIGSEEESQNQEEGDEDSFLAEMPIRKRRRIPEPETARLTKHFKLMQELPPLYTGGKFIVSKDGTRAWAMNNFKVQTLDLETGKFLSTLHEENEDLLTFAVSANEKYIATANKNHMIKVYNLNEAEPNLH